METSKKEVKKRSYKEFEADYIVFRDAKDNFLKKHGDAMSCIHIIPNKEKKFGLDFDIITNGEVFYKMYDVLN